MLSDAAGVFILGFLCGTLCIGAVVVASLIW
jgi:hypothetical protein